MNDESENEKIQQNIEELLNNSNDSSDLFIKHLENASNIVKKWPIWKQQVLGSLHE